MSSLAVFLLVMLSIDSIISIDSIRLRIENSSFEPCPHVKDGRLISNNTRLRIDQNSYDLQRYGVARLSHLEVIDSKGSLQELTLPGCFNVRLETSFTQSIDNPYVEAFVKSDRAELCQKFKPNPYCQPTDNLSARLLTGNLTTCRFCDFCTSANDLVSNLQKSNVDLNIKSTGNVCSDRKIVANQRYPLELRDVCTPPAADMERHLVEKFGSNWREIDFVRRGSIILTIHIMERRNPAPKPCLQLGSGTYKWKGPPSLENRVQENLRNTCQRYQTTTVTSSTEEFYQPKDDYLGCYYGYINYAIDRF